MAPQWTLPSIGMGREEIDSNGREEKRKEWEEKRKEWEEMRKEWEEKRKEWEEKRKEWEEKRKEKRGIYGRKLRMEIGLLTSSSSTSSFFTTFMAYVLFVFLYSTFKHKNTQHLLPSK